MMSFPPAPSPGVPFSFFTSLVREIAKIKPSPSKSRPPKASRTEPYPARQVFQKWVNELRKQFSPLPQGTTATCFRLLFPELDVPRKYEIQENRMCSLLADCFGVDTKAFEGWSHEQSPGCLGHELRVVLEKKSPDPDPLPSPLTIAEVDEYLNELASTSAWSHASFRATSGTGSPRQRKDIIRELFRKLSPEDAGLVVQIILKDLRPLLYPLNEYHYTAALLKYDSASVQVLTKEQAMYVWDPTGAMLKFYRARSSLEDTGAFFETPLNLRPSIRPIVGSLVAVPKSEKGIGCMDALSHFPSSARVWAETKYDGERAQIHVQKRRDGSFGITIFSKSGRDSTLDRYAVHEIIREALGVSEGRIPKINDHAILDAEMVACKNDQIEEFWRIRHLVQTTGRGIVRSRGPTARPDEELRQESMASEANEEMSLGLVFFDILSLDSKTLLSEPYSNRRQLLENLITTTPGRAMLADRFLVDMRAPDPLKQLRRIFAEHIATYQEGLVLKADESSYNDFRKPWVKLKKDFIPSYGDTLDFLLVGASWNKERARTLRVPRGTYTTFYIGVRCRSHLARSGPQPRIHVYFMAEYGLTRDQLEELNFLIKSSDPVCYPAKPSELKYSLSVNRQMHPEPEVILQTPLVVELFGAGFTKSPGSEFYELRFPRIIKYHRSSERNWKETIDSDELHKIACAAVGRDRADKDIDDWANTVWGKPCSPSVRSTPKRKALAALWDEKLALLDHKKARTSFPTLSKEDARPTTTSEMTPLTSNCSVPRTGMVLSNESSPALMPLAPRAPLQKQGPASPPVDVENISFPQQREQSSRLRDPLVWFVEVGKAPSCRCNSWKAWKADIPRNRRLHTLDSLIFGCGWHDESASEGPREEGIIIIDQCRPDAKEWTQGVIQRLDALRESGRKGCAILMYGCQSRDIPIYALE